MVSKDRHVHGPSVRSAAAAVDDLRFVLEGVFLTPWTFLSRSAWSLVLQLPCECLEEYEHDDL
eukprot:150938-Pleurochrysis_carterae.AAC.1